MQTNTTHLAKVIVFTLDAISLWTGRRRLKRDDLRLQSADEIPPDTIASLGSKKIIDPEAINDFERLKKEAHRECAKVGVKFLGGYAVPEDQADGLAIALDKIGAEFASLKATFLANYDQALADWVKAHPEWKGMLNEAALDRSEVDNRLHFGWSSFRVVAASDDDDSAALNAGLKSELGGLAGQLYREVAKEATQVMERSLVGRDKVTQRVLSPIRTIRGKLLGLSFLDSRVTPLIQTIDHVMSLLPKAGHIEGLGLEAFRGLIFVLSSEDRMIQHGELVLQSGDVEDAFVTSVPSLAAKAEEAEPETPAEAEPATPAPIQAPQVQSSDLFNLPPVASGKQVSLDVVAPPPVKRRGSLDLSF